jgi:hypothetical protein
MPLLGGLFGGEKHPNLARIARALQTNLGLQLATPTKDVLAVLNAMSPRDLIGFDNARTIEGMQELFKAKSIRAVLDPASGTVSLVLAPPEQIERELKAEHGAVRVIHVGERHASRPILKPAEPREPIRPQPATAAVGQQLAAHLPAAFEHLQAAERLCPTVVDVFVRHGQLTSGDKELLRNIRPADSSLESRVAALERWQTEMNRRVRGLRVPKATHHLLLGGDTATADHKPEETLLHRFDAWLHWLGKLIKAFERRGIKFHNKPVWLPR